MSVTDGACLRCCLNVSVSDRDHGRVHVRAHNPESVTVSISVSVSMPGPYPRVSNCVRVCFRVYGHVGDLVDQCPCSWP